LINQIVTCALCKHIHQQGDAVIGEGDMVRASIYMIGQDPGADEILEKRPFCGRSGKLLRRAMKEAGINEEDTYITNMNLHRSKDNMGFTLKERDFCWEAFGAGMLRESSAKIVITVGAKATETVFRQYGMEWKGFSLATKTSHIVEMEGVTRYVVPCVHPAYVLRGGGVGSQRYKELEVRLREARELNTVVEAR